MPEPTLVILAAGMGSRFGGLKQIMAVDGHGHAIIDFSLYDAYRAGFRKVAFIIKHAIEVCAKDAVDGPFAVINADDFYGPGAYQTLYDFLAAGRPENEHAMVAYQLRNTVTENGHVARGVCRIEDGLLADIVERTHVEKRGADAAFTEDGVNFTPIAGDTPVSMNFWGFGQEMMRELEARFPAWLDESLQTNPLKGEYFLPFVANACIKEKLATVKVLNCHEQWYGMTYKEDLQSVISAIRGMREKGVYPETLLD